MFEGRNIVICVTGSISAYKSAELVREFRRRGADVRVAMTRGGQAFMTPLTLATLSQHPVYVDVTGQADAWRMEHISLGARADLIIVAPASADIIAKLAQGVADDPVCATVADTTAPVLIAPAMNTRMYTNRATQKNIVELKSRGVSFVGPAAGDLACGEIGEGRLAEVSDILKSAEAILGKGGDLAGKKVLVTAGPTVEAWDSIRFFSNRSSGKMGYALAMAARDRGAAVTLVSGPTMLPAPQGVRTVSVKTAEDMRGAVLGQWKNSDALIMAAAVMDYRPKDAKAGKIKKTGKDVVLSLTENPDILKEAGASKGKRVLVGFAAEENGSLLANAGKKIKEKNLDLIVANRIDQEGAGFESDSNAVVLIGADGAEQEFALQPKRSIADHVLDRVARILKARKG